MKENEKRMKVNEKRMKVNEREDQPDDGKGGGVFLGVGVTKDLILEDTKFEGKGAASLALPFALNHIFR